MQVSRSIAKKCPLVCILRTSTRYHDVGKAHALVEKRDNVGHFFRAINSSAFGIWNEHEHFVQTKARIIEKASRVSAKNDLPTMFALDLYECCRQEANNFRVKREFWFLQKQRPLAVEQCPQ